VPLRRSCDLARLEQTLAARGIGAVALERMRWHRPRPRRCSALVIGLGNVDLLALPDAVARLDRAIRDAA